MTRLTLRLTLKTAAAALAIHVAGAQGAPPAAGGPDQDAMLDLANRSGCFICHAIAPSKEGATPLAPSYQEVALRYRDDPGAFDRLLDRVQHGTAYREQAWAGRVAMRFMPPNVNVPRGDAEALVQWVLALPLDGEMIERLGRYDRMLTLSTLSGCAICHRVDPVSEARVVPLAPSFREIAAHYRGREGAAERLGKSVLEGTQDRPKVWENVNMRFMPPNVNVRPEDAQALVDWILSLNTTGVRTGPRVPPQHP